MLYEVITLTALGEVIAAGVGGVGLADIRFPTGAVLDVGLELKPDPIHRRITSYNVCYTKLLRVYQKKQ